MLECVQQHGYAKGAEIYWLHRFKNLPEYQNMNRQELESEIVEVLRIHKLSKSTFDKTYSMYKKIQFKLMSRDIRDKIELLERR